jgi:hypothetical protein
MGAIYFFFMMVGAFRYHQHRSARGRHGRESTAELAAGVAYFRAVGVEHDVINGGDQDLIFVEIELVSR